MQVAAKFFVLVGGGFIGIECADRLWNAYQARKDNGNFAAADAELTKQASENGMMTEPATAELNNPAFHRDPPADSRVTYEVAREPDAAM